MPYDRRPSSNSDGRRSSSQPARRSGPRPNGANRPRREGEPTEGGLPGSRSARPAGRPPRSVSGRPVSGRQPPRRDPRAARVVDGERPRRYDSARPSAPRRERVPPRRVEPPRSAAQIRSAEVKAARGPREPRQQVAPAPWERETWIDDGPLRSEARKATVRAKHVEVEASPAKTTRRRKSLELAPELAEDLQRAAPALFRMHPLEVSLPTLSSSRGTRNRSQRPRVV